MFSAWTGRADAVRVPAGLQALVDDGIVDRVMGQLQSGKEAFVYVVDCGSEVRCAKVYKDAQQRSFRTATDYREGRRSRGSRDARAAGRRSRHGRKVQESQWKNAEVDALYKLAHAGVRVPAPHGVHEGVLLMELICDGSGAPAPRIGEVDMAPAQALEWHGFMIRQIVRMLCAGLIHGDLSGYNVLLDADGPVIIDLPQAVNASGNNNAFRLLARDVNNMRNAIAHAAPGLEETQYAIEIWDLYEAGELQPDTLLTGRHSRIEEAADVDAVLEQIDEARREAEARELGRQAAL
jgi:RIO kinase 1